MVGYSPDFVKTLTSDLQVLGKRRIVREEYPPTIPTYSREAIYAPSCRWGSTGRGKTINLDYWLIERYSLKAPEHGIKGFKIICIDFQKGELACAGIPMTPDHPLYPVIQEVGLEPQSYPVEVLRPLVFMRGEPDLLFEQPEIVKPFTLCLADLSLSEWICLFGGHLSAGQTNLHNQVLNELHSEIETVTMHDLYVRCQEILDRGNVGYGTFIKGLEETPTIPMTKKTFGLREGQGLLQKYTVLMNTSLVMPRVWKGKPVKTNLDIEKTLKNQRVITVVYIPKYVELPHLNYAVTNYILNHILAVKNPNRKNRVSTPVALAFPELKTFVSKKLPDEARYYMEPVRNTILNIVSQGTGMGITIDSDSQSPESIADEFRDNILTSFIYSLGEEAGEKIRELVKNRYVSNFKEITDEWHLSALNEAGTFIYLGYGMNRAQIRRNALISFWYPRARVGDSETETNYYDLYKRFHPDRFVNILPLYQMLIEINAESQSRAAEEMSKFLEGEEVQSVQKPKSKVDRALHSLVLALDNYASREGPSLEWGKAVEMFQYYQPEGQSAPIINFSKNHVVNLLKKACGVGYVFIDKSKGTRHWQVLVNQEKIKQHLAENKE